MKEAKELGQAFADQAMSEFRKLVAEETATMRGDAAQLHNDAVSAKKQGEGQVVSAFIEQKENQPAACNHPFEQKLLEYQAQRDSEEAEERLHRLTKKNVA